MTSRLGVYWSVMHRRPQDYEYFKRLQPSVFKIMDGGDVDYKWIRENLPNSLVIARIHALSEQHSDMLANPEETGKRHAREWNEHQSRLGFDRGKTLILGINEPRVWEAGVAEALRRYTIALCDQAAAFGLRVGAMQLGVGWPNNTGPDTPPDWTPWHGVEDAILRGNHALICHEYWADSGPAENWGWWGGRTLKCPWRVPIVIGECGVDMFVKSAQFEGNRGWYGHLTPERYASELAEYTGRMGADSRFVGCCVFASDFASHEWWSFDIEPAYSAILSTPVVVVPPTEQPPVTAAGSGYTQTYLNVRRGPGENYEVVETLDPGTPVAWDATAGAWLRIGADRWVRSDYVGETSPTHEPPPRPSDTTWERSIAWVLNWEGGFQNNPDDLGNYYNGQLIGTKYGISAAAWGGQYDIPNLTLEQAKSIYYEHYWLASMADKLPWPLCLLVFDTAVLHGTGTAIRWQKDVGANPYLFAAKRLKSYTSMSNWSVFGAGWTNRVATLLEEVGARESSV